jgi:hypothetical protein
MLVSRAFALVQFVTALLELTYLPVRFLSLIHHAKEISATGLSATGSYWTTYDQIEVVSLVVRIGGLLMIAILFWNCGPWIERILLPKFEA